MPRRIFPASTVTNTTGAALPLIFHATSTTGRRETDLWTVNGSNNLVERIPNGVILTDVTGAYSAFAGPDDVDTLYVGTFGGTRASISATDTVAGGTALDATTFAKRSNNLSDLASASTARTNLGLGSLATLIAITTSEITNGTITTSDINTSSFDARYAKLSGGGVDPLAVALGYINWTHNNQLSTGANALTSQRADAVGIWLPAGLDIISVLLTVTTAGTSTAPTGFFVGLCSATKMLAQSNNLASSSNLTSTGTKAFALNATYTTSASDSASGLYYLVVLQNGAFAGTNVVFQRGQSSTPGYAPSGGASYGNIGTGLTGFVSNGAAVTVSASSGLPWHAGVA